MRFDARTALYCPEYLHKTHAPKRFDLSLRLLEGENKIADEYKRLGGVHEDKVLKKIRDTELSVVQIDLSQSFESREIQTAKALLRTDVDMILGASIGEETENELKKTLGDKCAGDPDRVSRPDLLVRIAVADGFPIWAPVDVKSHKAFNTNTSNEITRTDLELKEIPTEEPIQGRWSETDSLQLAHYMTHLQNIGLAPHDLKAGIIGKDGEKISWGFLDKVTFGRGKNAVNAMTTYQEQFIEAKELALTARKRNDDETIHVDSIARSRSDDFGCAKCEFQDVCLKEMNEFDNGKGHVTLLARVTANVRSKNFPQIESITDMRQATDLNKAGDDSKIRARVWQTQIPEMMDPAESLDIPQFDVEIDIDLENSQAALFEAGIEDIAGKDQVYLYGYGIHDRTVDKDWRSAKFDSFSNYGDDEAAEIDVLMRMWNFLKEQVAQAESQGKTVGIFHYSHHEKMWWERFAKRHAAIAGVPTLHEVETFMDKYFVDLLVHSRLVALPTRGYGIKLLAPLANFSWEVADPGGAGSLLYYRNSVDATKTESQRQAARHWLYSYNLDDCRATFAVRDYLRSLKL